MQKQQTLRLMMLLLICSFILPILTGCEKRETIVNALSEKEANEILVFLSTKGIEAKKVKSVETGGGAAAKITLWDISVPAEKKTEAMFVLNQAGLPRRRGESLLGIFKDVGLVPSEMQEKIRYQAGLAEQIANVIRKIDGVLDAEVQISFPEEDPLNPGASKEKITASVYVKHSGALDDPNKHLITKIKRLVTGSITGLKYDNVTVISDRTTFAEFPTGFEGFGEEEKDFVSVWSIIVAKESLTRFRVFFFSAILVILVLLTLLIWTGWKVYPIFKEHGGMKELFHLKPLVEGKKPAKKAPSKEGEEEGEEGDEEEGESEPEEDAEGEEEPGEEPEEEEPTERGVT